ncbi:hypothetical protein GN316_03110 [Xylophilus sp. Kf1]|nr:hypothetical protein [Xylophilus sp. Kf1]
MNNSTLCAPQYGVWCSVPPRMVDNPAVAGCPVRPSPHIRETLARLRAEAAARADTLRKSAYGVWK